MRVQLGGCSLRAGGSQPLLIPGINPSVRKRKGTLANSHLLLLPRMYVFTIHPSTCSFIHLPTNLSIYPPTYPFIHPFTYLPTPTHQSIL